MRIVSKQSASPETPTARSRRVVVAEDETLIRLDIVETLTEAGYEVGVYFKCALYNADWAAVARLS